MASDGVPEGTWLRADRQSAGRGRGGRAWESAAGNLLCSGLVRLMPADPPASGLGLVAGLAAHDALADHAGAAALLIKWPNDIIANGAKLCGILLERRDDAVAVGFGVNVAEAPAIAGRATTCLAALAPVPELDVLWEALASAFERRLAQWRTAGLAPIIADWSLRAHPAGTPIEVHEPDGSLRAGAFEGLSTDGGLIIALADGRRHVMHAGDVFML